MDHVRNDIDELIGKVLAGEGTVQEQETVLKWAKESEANRQYYEHLKTIFEKADATEIKIQFDTDAAWNKVRKKIQKEPARVIPLNGNQTFNQVLRIAAGIKCA